MKEEVIIMKNKIHPDMKETTITCACGEEYQTMSTKENIRVEVCSSCHPFYTGGNKKSTQGGRIERFNEKFGFNEEDEEVTVEETEKEEENIEKLNEESEESDEQETKDNN